MRTVRLLEFQRSPDGIWDVPPALMAALARDVPGVHIDSPATREEAEALLPQADVLFGALLRPSNLHLATRLRWVHTSAAGVDHVLFPGLVASDIVVTNSRGLHADAMAEHALGLMLAVTRKLHHARDRQRESRWDQIGLLTGAPAFDTLAGRTLGIIGFGTIGAAIAQRARAFDMRVLGVRRHPGGDPAPAHEVHGLDRLDDVLAVSDWVVAVLPRTDASTHLIDAARFARMKPGARFMNLGRGSAVDEAALVAALRSGHLAGAALDVFEEEPLPPHSPLWSMPEVIVTPHTSGLAPRLWERAIELLRENLARFVAGEPLLHVVDKQAGY